MMSDESSVESSDEEIDQGREQGVDIGSLADELDDHTYPATNGEILSAYGGHEIELLDESKPLDEILGKIGREDVTYGSADEVRQMIYNLVGSDAVGREGYSDRGGIAGERHHTEERTEPEDDTESL